LQEQQALCDLFEYVAIWLSQRVPFRFQLELYAKTGFNVTQMALAFGQAPAGDQHFTG
jgi:hypothetical protein